MYRGKRGWDGGRKGGRVRDGGGANTCLDTKGLKGPRTMNWKGGVHSMLPDVGQFLAAYISYPSERMVAYHIRKDKKTLSQGSFLPSACVTHDMSHVFSSPGKVWLGTCHEEAIVVITKGRGESRMGGSANIPLFIRRRKSISAVVFSFGVHAINKIAISDMTANEVH